MAEYGDRLPPVHVGRIGDPVIPSVYDHYALSKIKGELAVMQSRIKHRVSLRQTFIMIPGLFSLMDPIMFHQPINSFMENITARDSGRLMASCLDIPGDSDFWGGYYNISGGPECRITLPGVSGSDLWHAGHPLPEGHEASMVCPEEFPYAVF